MTHPAYIPPHKRGKQQVQEHTELGFRDCKALPLVQWKLQLQQRSAFAGAFSYLSEHFSKCEMNVKQVAIFRQRVKTCLSTYFAGTPQVSSIVDSYLLYSTCENTNHTCNLLTEGAPKGDFLHNIAYIYVMEIGKSGPDYIRDHQEVALLRRVWIPGIHDQPSKPIPWPRYYLTGIFRSGIYFKLEYRVETDSRDARRILSQTCKLECSMSQL